MNQTHHDERPAGDCSQCGTAIMESEAVETDDLESTFVHAGCLDDYLYESYLDNQELAATGN